MTERQGNRTVDEAVAELMAKDPELRVEHEASRPAYLVARELMRARQELGLSQAEVAERMGTTQSVISRIERMDTTPTLETANRLARALGLTLELRFLAAGQEIAGEGAEGLIDAPDWLFGSSEEFAAGVTAAFQDANESFQATMREYFAKFAADHPAGRFVRRGPDDESEAEEGSSHAGASA